MTELEAIDEVAHLKGLFQKMPTEQMAWWKGRFTRYELRAVRRAIDVFAERYSEHVDRAGLLTLIEQQQGKVYLPRDPAKDRADADTHWAEVEATLARLKPEQFERLRQTALAGLPEQARAYLAAPTKPPGRMLRAVMYQRLKKSMLAAASA